MNAHRVKKDRRKEYTGSKRFDHSCRCHGSCGWCSGNRLYQDRRDRVAADQELKDYAKPRFSTDTNDAFWEEV